jgi:glycine cleavage system pyridoxal-binding protein P
MSIDWRKQVTHELSTICSAGTCIHTHSRQHPQLFGSVNGVTRTQTHQRVGQFCWCAPPPSCVQVCDLRALTDIAHDFGAIVLVDNSIMTAVFQCPLQLGADISMVSVTKFVGGHSDVTGGILSFKDEALAKKCALLLFVRLCLIVLRSCASDSQL